MNQLSKLTNDNNTSLIESINNRLNEFDSKFAGLSDNYTQISDSLTGPFETQLSESDINTIKELFTEKWNEFTNNSNVTTFDTKFQQFQVCLMFIIHL